MSPWLDEATMAEMKPIEYKSRDGLTIHGYLTLPVGMEPKNLPSWSTRTAGRGAATAGGSTPRCSSWPTAATPSSR